MRDAARRDEPQPPARFAHAMHQLHFLEIEEEAVIEEAGLSQRRAAQHDAGAGQPLRRAGIVTLDDRGRDAQPLAEPAEAGAAHQLAARRGEVECRSGQRAVRFQQLAAHAAQPRIGPNHIEQRRDGTRLDERVRIEQMDELGRVGALEQAQHRLIVGPAEAAIEIEREDADPIAPGRSREMRGELLRRSIARIAVHDSDIERTDRRPLRHQRLDAADHIIRCPVVHDHDRERRSGGSHRRSG